MCFGEDLFSLNAMGSRLKEFRKKRGLTLAQLAEASGISVSSLSKIERDLNVPTVVNLQKICAALNVTINDLAIEGQGSPCVKKADRKPLYENSDSLYEQATPSNETLKGNILTLFPGSEIKTYEHLFDEVGLVLSGSVEADLDGVRYDLAGGDTLYIRKGSSHFLRNPSKDENCVMYWVKAAPSMENPS
jgi:transcriptional regulator with XRE-family HTH domain